MRASGGEVSLKIMNESTFSEQKQWESVKLDKQRTLKWGRGKARKRGTASVFSGIRRQDLGECVLAITGNMLGNLHKMNEG